MSFKRRFYASTLVLAAMTVPVALRAAESEEQRLVRMAQMLKPISDTQWNEIAGGKTGDTYDIQRGDTLWDVSKRLFGNSFYWPKVWSLNAGIGNPHIVAPGQKLVFTPGSSENVPKLAPADQNITPVASPSFTPRQQAVATASAPETSRRKDYEKIDPRKWAPVDLTQRAQVAKEYDEYGLDRDLKIQLPRRFVFRVPAIANDTTVPFLGEVVGSRRDGVGLSEHETVFLKSNGQDLQVGTTYSVLSEPDFVREKKSDRAGYIYQALGELRIIGVKDELYIGVITKAYDAIRRGDRLYPLLPLITDIKPIPSAIALEALVMTSNEATDNTAQFRFIHLDRGIEDGVQVGNVFRVYDYYDPTTRQKLTDSDFLVNADALVVHATAQFSTALVFRSRETFSRGDFGVMLTDVSDLERQIRDRSRGLYDEEQKAPEDKELDELDELDRTSGEGLGTKEATEIKELDQWDKTKDLQTQPNEEPTLPSDAGNPSDPVEQFPGPETQSPAETGTEPEPTPSEPTLDEPATEPSTQEPTLDEELDKPAPRKEAPATLDTSSDAPDEVPQAPPSSGDAPPETLPDAEAAPNMEPLTPETAPMVEPFQPAMPDDIESPSR